MKLPARVDEIRAAEFDARRRGSSRKDWRLGQRVVAAPTAAGS
jgi:hypothetical protein